MNENKIKEILRENGYYNDKSTIVKLSGDASSREYYRLYVFEKSFIICTEEPNGQQSKDFQLITSLISEKIQTPEIFFYKPESSILVLEDVGDVSLKDFYNSNGLSMHKKAVDDIKTYQDMDIQVCQNRFFDREKIGFEFDLAINYFVKQYLKIDISNENKIIHDIREKVISYYESHKDVVCHRDYHSNNLYIKEETLYHIDYQDMRVGPKIYDLVSLVDDCYISLSDEERQTLLNRFDKDFINLYRYDYQIVQIQRTFKALGSFAYLSIEKGKNGYLPFIDNNLKKLINVLNSCDDMCFKSFASILERGINA